jgi:hypothetical protein
MATSFTGVVGSADTGHVLAPTGTCGAVYFVVLVPTATIRTDAAMVGRDGLGGRWCGGIRLQRYTSGDAKLTPEAAGGACEVRHSDS